jgi:ribosomal protein S18 acetylase RimI-like enzyme
MRGNITLRPADSVSAAAFVEALNQAYRDYHPPLGLDTRSFKETVAREAVMLDASVVALDGVKIVGMAVLGVRPPRGWIGGLGVVPAHRRRGIARAMMEYLLDRARSLSLHTLQLEVVTHNEAARALYESLGFVEQRRLLVLTCQPGRFVHLPAAGHPCCETRPADEALNLLATLDRVTRAWSRDALSLMPFARQFRALVSLHLQSDEPVGACVYIAHPFQVSMVTLAGSPGAGGSLLNALHDAHPQATMSYANVPAEDPMLPELRRAGYNETLSQFEMLHVIER